MSHPKHMFKLMGKKICTILTSIFLFSEFKLMLQGKEIILILSCTLKEIKILGILKAVPFFCVKQFGPRSGQTFCRA